MSEENQINRCPAIELKEVRFAYSDRLVLDALDFRLLPGEKVGLAGAMGSGKTTLLHIIVGLIRPQRGAVGLFGKPCVKEKDFEEVRRRVGLVFQDADDQLFCPTVMEDLVFGPLNLGKTMDEARAQALTVLDRLGLTGYENRVTYRLSGGEKRLVSLATVLTMEPDVLLLDEPQNGLDEEACERIQNLLQQLPQGMVIVSHDHTFLEAVTDRCVYLKNGGLPDNVAT